MDTWVMSVAAVWALGFSNTTLCSGDPGNASCFQPVTFYIKVLFNILFQVIVCYCYSFILFMSLYHRYMQ